MAIEKASHEWSPKKWVFQFTFIVAVLALLCCIWKTISPPTDASTTSDTRVGPAGTTVVHRFDYVMVRNGTDQAWNGVKVEVFMESGGSFSIWDNQEYTFDMGPHQVHAFVMNRAPGPGEEIRKVVCKIPDPGDPSKSWECTLMCDDPGWQFRNATFTFGSWNQTVAGPPTEHLLAGQGFINNPTLPQDNLVLVHKTSTKP